jgi:hypothetical protein
MGSGLIILTVKPTIHKTQAVVIAVLTVSKPAKLRPNPVSKELAKTTSPAAFFPVPRVRPANMVNAANK